MELSQPLPQIPNKEKITFLHLPLEIRQEIYMLALVFDKPLEVSGRPRRKLVNRRLGLMRANRQIAQETAPLFYGNNKI